MIDAMFRDAPVNAHALDHSANPKAFARRTPKRSTIHPAVTCMKQYHHEKAESISPIVSVLIPSSRIMKGAAIESVPRCA
jgi:hypothetical protein